MAKLKILIFSGWYLPGYRGGGPIRTLANMVDRLGDEFEFKIVTADRDSQDTKHYPGVVIDGWNNVGKAKVFYMSPDKRSLWDIRKIFWSTEYNVLYLNSFFSYFTIKPLLLRRLQLIPSCPLLIAPRGEFSPCAFGYRRVKKLVYTMISKVFGFYQGATLQASSKYEESDIRHWFGSNTKVVIAPDLPPLSYASKSLTLEREKIKNCLKIIFLSRISLMKNLYGVLEILSGLKEKIQFNIFGPMEDKEYWIRCQKIISNLPENIGVQYHGNIPHEWVVDVMGEHDLFFLPTLGENFGHVILEALCAGCPVLISDRTPWRGLEAKGVGWDLPLDRPELFRGVIQMCFGMDSIKYKELSNRAQEYGFQAVKDGGAVKRNRLLFQYAIDGASD